MLMLYAIHFYLKHLNLWSLTNLQIINLLGTNVKCFKIGSDLTSKTSPGSFNTVQQCLFHLQIKDLFFYGFFLTGGSWSLQDG